MASCDNCKTAWQKTHFIKKNDLFPLLLFSQTFCINIFLWKSKTTDFPKRVQVCFNVYLIQHFYYQLAQLMLWVHLLTNVASKRMSVNIKFDRNKKFPTKAQCLFVYILLQFRVKYPTRLMQEFRDAHMQDKYIQV